MIRRQREILSIILNTDGFITGSELARLCDVSVRTIRLDIKEINNLLEEYDLKINSEIKKGYCLNEENKRILKENNIIRSVLDYEYIMETPITPFERQMYIISKLTIKEYVSVEELEDKLYVSLSTVNKDIISAKKWLKENLNLNISYSLSKGIKLSVSEKEKRNIISWILSYKLNASTLSKQLNYLFEDNDINDKASELYFIVSSETSKYGYFLSGHSSQFFCIEVMVAITRVQLGYNLEEDKEIKDELMPVIVALREKIQSYFNITLSNAEWLNLQQYFISKQFISKTNIKNIETNEACEIVNEFLIKLKNKYNVDLMITPALKEKLVLYVAPMLNRLKNKHCIGNKVNENISEIHPLEFKMSCAISDIVKQQLNLTITTIELSYITIYLVAAYKIWSKKLNSIIVCDYDESVISYIKERIFNYHEDKITLSGCYTYQQFVLGKKEAFKNVDFIVTTSTIADRTNIPFIQISPAIEEKDIININEYLDNVKRHLEMKNQIKMMKI